MSKTLYFNFTGTERDFFTTIVLNWAKEYNVIIDISEKEIDRMVTFKLICVELDSNAELLWALNPPSIMGQGSLKELKIISD